MEHKYGPERTDLYIHLEAGHAAQNLLLQAVTLGLSAVPIGGFFEDQVVQVLAIQPERPLYVIAAGHTVARESQFSLHVPVGS
jgi:nitroreductase